MLAFVLSQVNVATTFDAAVVPVLQTRAPTGNVSGPSEAGLFESRPTTSQVIGSIVSAAAANPAPAIPNPAMKVPTTSATSAARKDRPVETAGRVGDMRRSAPVRMQVQGGDRRDGRRWRGIRAPGR
jgi:hypothetical protein